MSSKTKSQLRTENNSSFPNNNSQLITPEILRTFNEDIIDSMVSNEDSGSFTVDSGSLLTTASFDNGTRDMTFTKGDGSTFDVNIPDATVETGSLLTTASVSDATITFTKGDSSTFDVTVNNVVSATNATNADNIELTADNTNTNRYVPFTATANGDGALLTDAGLLYNSFTNTLTATTFNGDLSGNASTATTATSANSVEYSNVANKPTLVSGSSQLTSSYDTRYALSGSGVTSIIAGTNITIDQSTGDVTINSSGGGSADTGSLLTTASADFSIQTFTKGDGSTFEVDVTPRQVIETVKNKEGYTLPKGTPVYASGSTGNAVHVYAASSSRADRMPAAYVLNEELTSDAEGNGLLLGFINGVDTSAFTSGDVIYVGANGGYTNQKPTGSNQIQNLGKVIVSDGINGSGVVSGAGRSNDLPNITQGYLWVGDSDGVPQAVTTSSLIPQGTISGSDQLTGSYDSRYFQLNADNNSNGNNIFSGSIETAAGTTLLFGEQSAVANFSSTPIWQYPRYSNLDGRGIDTNQAQLSLYGNNTNEVFAGTVAFEFETSGSNLVGASKASFGPLANQMIVVNNATGQQSNLQMTINNLNQATMNIGANNISLMTNPPVESAEIGNPGSTVPIYMQQQFVFANPGNGYSTPLTINIDGSLTASADISSSASIHGNQFIGGTVTASLQEGYVWVGDSTNTTTTVATSSFGGGGSGFPFTGDAVISGSLQVTGSVRGDVVTLTDVAGTTTVDFEDGNMFVLTLPSNSNTVITPSNIKAGQTVNIQITQPATTGSCTFASSVKFAGGYPFTATTTGSAVDMLTMVSYDGTNVLATGIKNFS